MTPLSRWPLSKSEEDRIKEVLSSELTEVADKKKMVSLLKSLLTESEYLMVAKRLMAFVLIDEGYVDVKIAKILHVTRATANRFRLVYKYAKEKDEPVVELVNKVRLSYELKEVLKKVLFKYALPAALGRIPR